MLSESIVGQVRKRAGGRCEYCGMAQEMQGATFHVEHIVPRSRGGESFATNLALACPSCNLHKSDRTESIDPETGEMVALFHPRRDRWEDHFVWRGFNLAGTTSKGRATIDVLNLNHPRRIRVRNMEQKLDLFPPPESPRL